jgi:hypothetical protein
MLMSGCHDNAADALAGPGGDLSAGTGDGVSRRSITPETEIRLQMNGKYATITDRCISSTIHLPGWQHGYPRDDNPLFSFADTALVRIMAFRSRQQSVTGRQELAQVPRARVAWHFNADTGRNGARWVAQGSPKTTLFGGDNSWH